MKSDSNLEENSSEKIIETPEEAATENMEENEEAPDNKNLFLYLIIAGIVLLLVVSYGIYLVGANKKDEISIEDLTITQPFVENNEFKSFILKNGLKVLLSKTNDGMENSFVSLTVGVGSQSDPEDFCGFTHLIEHLLFTGSKNFPEDNYIEKVINKYNGENNGVTKSFTTSYYYKVGKGGLAEFAEVLADAVAYPLFDEERITKEMNNVNSEISMRMTFNKNLGYYKMLKKIGNPDARIFRDGFANIDIENQDLKKLHSQINAFHQKYYSANIMTLSVITDQEISEVEQTIRKEFSDIPNKEIERPTYTKDTEKSPYQRPFNEFALGNIYYMQGFSKPSQLTLLFEVPAERQNHEFHPLEYFSFFLNYYSRNSLKDQLINEDLITGFEDELTLQDYVRGIYLVRFDLTEKGEKHVSKIMVEFFKFVRFILGLKSVKNIYDEASKFSKFAFLFNISSEYLMFPEVEQDNFQRVLQFSEKMQEYSNNQIFTADQIWVKFKKYKFDQVLLDLKPENSIIMIESMKFEMAEESELIEWEVNDINGVNEQDRTIEKISDEIRATTKSQLESLTNLQNGGSHSSHSGRELYEIVKKMDPNSQMRKKMVDALAEAPRKSTLKLSTDDSEEQARLLNNIFYQPFFDKAIDTTRLAYALDFDNNKKFHYEKIPAELWKKFHQNINHDPTKFDGIDSLEIGQIMKYDMITNCIVPNEMNDKKSIGMEINKQQQTMDTVNTKEEVIEIAKKEEAQKGVYTSHIDLGRLSDVLFNQSTDRSVLTQKMLLIRGMLMYKICMIDEFDKDDDNPKPDLIMDTPRLKVYHKLYRKTLQPKYAIRIMIENPYFQENIIKGTSADKQRFYLQTELLCLYIKHYLSLEYYKDFIRGNDLSVSSRSYAIYITFMGISTDVSNFTEKLLRAMSILTTPENYDADILSNLRVRIINTYSNYSTLTSLKHSTYIIDLIMDELSIDIRTEQNLTQIEGWINSITKEELANTFNMLQKNNKLTVLYTGNVSKEFCLTEVGNIKSFLLKDLQEGDTTSNYFAESINNVLDNMLLRFEGKNHHYMVRLPNIDPEDRNNVYVTYFRTRKETIEVKIIGAMISHWMRNYVFDKLRNQMNLGYVAYESIREYYYRTGVIILVQGEKFRPNEIEGDIEDTIREFMVLLNKKTNAEVEELKAVILEYYTEFTNSLDDVTSKEWDFLEEEYVLNENEDYEKVAENISKEDLIDYCQTTFYDLQRRLTVQLFSNKVTPEEQKYRLEDDKMLVDMPYDFKTVDEMIKIRESSVAKFSRELMQQRKKN